MDPLKALLAAAAGYLIGSISFGRLVARIAAPDKDISRTEFRTPDSEDAVVSEIVSATTISIHLGPRFGFITVVLDMLKITIPTLVFKHVYPDTPYFLITAATGMIGHVWPLYHGFKGGRGLSAVYGGMFAIDWIGAFATSIGGMLLGLIVLRDMLAAYMGGLWLVIPWLWFRTHDVNHLLYAIAVNLIAVLAEIPELRQYLKYKREGKAADLSNLMQLTGMGRGIYKMAKRLGVVKEEPTGHADDGGQVISEGMHAAEESDQHLK
jgi:glycerol-3-phosphate acyltransferase PlsY